MNPDLLQLNAQNTWVLICTYERNGLLADLLASLRAVRMPTGSATAHPQVVVVDNSEHAEAEALVRQTYSEAVYVHEPTPGIATARNASLRAVPEGAAAVIFVDDDEQVDPQWFIALLGCANASGADAVSGPVLSTFADGEPEWLATYGFVRRTDFPTGPHPRRLATNNTLVRCHWFDVRGFSFDEGFNFTGGSDSDLFERMLNAHAQFWWCAEAVVTEGVPAARTSREWLRRRALRGGQVRAMKRRRRARAGPPAVTAQIAAEGLARAGYGALRRMRKRLGRRPVTYTDDFYLCEGLGMLLSLTGRSRHEYARSA